MASTSTQIRIYGQETDDVEEIVPKGQKLGEHSLIEQSAWLDLEEGVLSPNERLHLSKFEWAEEPHRQPVNAGCFDAVTQEILTRVVWKVGKFNISEAIS